MQFLRGHQIEILLALAALVLVQFVVIWSLNNRVQRLARSFRKLLTGPTGEDLEALIHLSLEECRATTARCVEVEEHCAALRGEMRGCLQHIGLVRYDAFHDVAGHQSFSLAMLDGDLNGAIITGLFGRQDSRCFSKAVVEGRTMHALSSEEEQALLMAINGGLSSYLHSRNGAARAAKKRDHDDE